MINYLKILSHSYSGKKWAVSENSSYEEIQWLDKSTKPSQAEMDNLDLDWNLEEAKQKAIENRKVYLNSTDWYIAREADQLNSYPEEIKDKRILARTEINQIEQETDINNITVIF